jgi:hypothetical protein
MKHVVMFSGGIGSWAAAKRVVQAHGTADLTLLFTDTLIEDEDLYRFLNEASANIGVPVTRIAEGRTPWQVFFDVRFLGNSRVDPCSRVLKREMAERWLKDNCDPLDTEVYVGIDWSEEHRFTNLSARHAGQGWTYKAPMCDPPELMKRQMLDALAAEGIKPPRLYAMGFSHNNCGGFCIKAGQGHFALLFQHMPDRYLYHEGQEQEIRAFLGKDVAIMTDRSGDGKKKPLTLRAFRERIEAGFEFDRFDIGGCGCFVDEPEESA